MKTFYFLFLISIVMQHIAYAQKGKAGYQKRKKLPRSTQAIGADQPLSHHYKQLDMKVKPALKLRQLILAKYGSSKFSLGCFIVAQWLNSSASKNNFNGNVISKLCKAETIDDRHISILELELLCKLFGLQHYTALFSKPAE